MRQPCLPPPLEAVVFLLSVSLESSGQSHLVMCSWELLFSRVTLLDIMIAKIVGDEQLTKDDISIFLRHAELIANSFVDQCRNVLKLTSEPQTEDKVRRHISGLRDSREACILDSLVEVVLLEKMG